MNAELVRNIVLFGILSYLSFVDMRKKEVPAWPLWIMVIGGVMWQLFGKISCYHFIMSIIPGFLLLGISKLSGEQVGFGDGLLIMGLGLFLGGREITVIVCISLLFSFCLAILVLITKKGNRKTRIPFIPCILSGLLSYFAFIC